MRKKINGMVTDNLYIYILLHIAFGQNKALPQHYALTLAMEQWPTSNVTPPTNRRAKPVEEIWKKKNVTGPVQAWQRE